MKRRICFPVEESDYRKIVNFCAEYGLTRGGLFCELMGAFFAKRHPTFSKVCEFDRPTEEISPVDPKAPIQGGGLHSF